MTRTLALIPARSGSKGLPGKNVRPFCGKPLLLWAIEIGLETCDRTVVSTDSADYAILASLQGCDVLERPESLARDDTPMLEVVQNALNALRSDVVVLLQPTSPLRTTEHVLEALRLLEVKQADSVVSVVQIPQHMSPDYSGSIKEDGRLVFSPAIRRQDTRLAYYRDGTVYVTRAEFIREGSLYGHKCIPLIIPADESATIDSEEDWKRAEAMMRVSV